MLCILQLRNARAAQILILGAFALALVLSFVLPADADEMDREMDRAAPQRVALFTQAMPCALGPDTRLAGLSVIEIERLNALGAHIVHVQLSEGHVPADAVAILNTTFPHAHFELFEDFEVEEAAADLIFDPRSSTRAADVRRRKKSGLETIAGFRAQGSGRRVSEVYQLEHAPVASYGPPG